MTSQRIRLLLAVAIVLLLCCACVLFALIAAPQPLMHNTATAVPPATLFAPP